MKFLFLLTCGVSALTSAAVAEVDFAHQVGPILTEHCGECHTGDSRKGGLSMNTREALLAGSEYGPVVVPGDAEDGLFMELILSKDRTERMPPKGKRVPPDQIAVLEDWINSGMKWDEGVSLGEDAYEPPLKPRRPELPPAVAGRNHPVDRIIDQYFAENEVDHPQPLTDAIFARRLSLDLTGLLPAPEQLTEFVKSDDPEKRTKLIASLLGDDLAYAEHWISMWNDLLRNDYQGTGYIDGGRKPVTGWLYQALLENKPYDQFATELLAPPTPASEGFIGGIQWRGSVNASQTTEVQFAQSITQTFLGLNMKCASCHDSFVDRWKLDEAYGLAAIFAEKPLEIARCDKPTGEMAKAAWIFPELGEVDADAPRPERLKQLAALMTHPENGRFTRTIVNRLWERMMGRGIVHPVDSMDSPPWSEDLLDMLAIQFAEDGYDIKKALTFIASSAIYQSQSVVSAEPAMTPFRGPMPKRMTAEQFVDAVWTLTGTAPAETHPNVPRPGPKLEAQWIWSHQDASSSAPAGEVISLGTQVELAAAPVSARAVFIADNEVEIYINGMAAASASGDPTPQTVDLKHFKAGKNSIVAVVRNGGTAPNPAGFIFEAHLEIPDSAAVVIATGSDWKWSAMLPDSDGAFAKPPSDWKSAELLASPGVWATSASSLQPGPAGSSSKRMVRASLVVSDLLMRALGRPNREQIVSMRPDNITTLEAIDLANGGILADLLKRGAARFASEETEPVALIESIFLRALGRSPSADEVELLVGAMSQQPKAQAIEDVLWLVLLLPEFQFVR